MGKLLHFPKPKRDNKKHKKERKVLGDLLLGISDYRQFCRLSDWSFTEPKNIIIFRAMREIFHNEEDLDLVTLCDELVSNGRLEKAGGAAYIYSLTDSIFDESPSIS